MERLEDQAGCAALLVEINFLESRDVVSTGVLTQSLKIQGFSSFPVQILLNEALSPSVEIVDGADK